MPPWPIPVLFIHNVPTFDMYVTAIAGNTSLMPGGAFISHSHSPPHIVILNTMHLLALRVVFIHELVHALVHHLRMPLWLEEGICFHLQLVPLRIHNAVYPDHRDPKRNEYWKTHGLDSFWNGSCFGHAGAHEGYFLAARIVRRLLDHGTDPFFTFVRLAQKTDNGEAACHQLYHRPLHALATEILGTST